MLRDARQRRLGKRRLLLERLAAARARAGRSAQRAREMAGRARERSDHQRETARERRRMPQKDFS